MVGLDGGRVFVIGGQAHEAHRGTVHARESRTGFQFDGHACRAVGKGEFRVVKFHRLVLSRDKVAVLEVCQLALVFGHLHGRHPCDVCIVEGPPCRYGNRVAAGPVVRVVLA